MPASVKITIQNKVYTTPILNEEMDNIAQQIQTLRDEITTLNSRLTNNINNLVDLQNQLLVIYIQQTGSLPN
jgi:hypothetical protein